MMRAMALLRWMKLKNRYLFKISVNRGMQILKEVVSKSLRQPLFLVELKTPPAQAVVMLPPLPS